VITPASTTSHGFDFERI